ncbi:hypothetical protein Tco_1101403, partial [Tanacetum coccineum]
DIFQPLMVFLWEYGLPTWQKPYGGGVIDGEVFRCTWEVKRGENDRGVGFMDLGGKSLEEIYSVLKLGVKFVGLTALVLQSDGFVCTTRPWVLSKFGDLTKQPPKGYNTSCTQASIGIYNGIKDTIEFQDYWSSAAMANVMQNILQMLNNTCHWMGPTAVADNANVVLLCQQHSCGLCRVLWEGLYYSLHHPTSLIPYPRFTKIIVNHYMTIFPDISKRARDMYHNLQDDDIMNNIFNSGRHKNKVGMKIQDWMLTDEMKQSEHYRMYTEVFGIGVPMIQSQPTESTHGMNRSTSALISVKLYT